MRFRVWIGGLVAVLVAAGCYYGDSADEADDGEDGAVVRIRIGGDAKALGAGGGDGLVPLGFVPEEVTDVDLRVTGEGMADFSQRYTIPEDRELVIEATFPAGASRRFEIDALRVGETETVLYQGATVQDLDPGPNDVVVEMEGRGSLQGTVYYVQNDEPFAPVPSTETPVAFETVTFTEVETAAEFQAVTDGNGGYDSGPLPLGVYRIDVTPGECLYAGWDGCLSFARRAVAGVGDAPTTDLLVIPPVGVLDEMPWATAVVPLIAQRGVDAVTVFGRDFASDPGGPGVALIYFSAVADDPGPTLDPVDSTPEEIIGTIPGEFETGIGFAFGEGFGLPRSYSNPVPFTIIP
jgi:hypothetical protein